MDVRSLLLFAAFAFLAFIAFVAADEDFEEEDIDFRVPKNKGGTLIFGRKKGGKKRDLGREGFTVNVLYVIQKDNMGKDVGKPVRSLENQAFKVSPFRKNAMFQGVKAAHIDLKAYLKEPQANLTLSVYIFRDAGNVTFGDESTEVQKGTIKLFFKVENYTFCDGNANNSICQGNKAGEFLEVAIIMRNKDGSKAKEDSEEEREKRKGPRRPDEKKRGIRCPRNAKCFKKIFRLNNDEVALADGCDVDGENRPMAPGFPKVEVMEGGKQKFVFKGPRFNRTVIFDPVIELAADEDDDDDDDDKDHATSIQLNLFMFVALLAVLFM